MIRHDRRSKSCLLAVIALALTATAAHAAAGDWREATCDVRVPITVNGDLHAREDARAELVLDFDDLLGPKRRLAAFSLRLRECAKGRRVSLDLAEDPDVKQPDGNPTLRLRWSVGKFPAFGEAHYHLYLATVAPGDRRAWRTFSKTFSSRLPPSVLMKTSFETPHPKHADWPLEIRPWGEDTEGIKTERIWTEETLVRERNA